MEERGRYIGALVILVLIVTGALLTFLGAVLIDLVSDYLSFSTPAALVSQVLVCGVLGFLTFTAARRVEDRGVVIVLSVAVGSAITPLLTAFSGGPGYFQPTTPTWVFLYTLITFSPALGALVGHALANSRVQQTRQGGSFEGSRAARS